MTPDAATWIRQEAALSLQSGKWAEDLDPSTHCEQTECTPTQSFPRLQGAILAKQLRLDVSLDACLREVEATRSSYSDGTESKDYVESLEMWQGKDKNFLPLLIRSWGRVLWAWRSAG